MLDADRVDGMQPVGEGGDDPEVPAATAERPEQILVLGLARPDEAPVG
jgi:hypothetical protein